MGVPSSSALEEPTAHLQSAFLSDPPAANMATTITIMRPPDGVVNDEETVVPSHREKRGYTTVSTIAATCHPKTAPTIASTVCSYGIQQKKHHGLSWDLPY